MQYLIFGNYGNATLALMAWAKQCALEEVTIAHVDTHWAAATWLERVTAGMAYAKQCGFDTQALSARKGFADLVKDRGSFPSQKFQWCPGILKGLPLLNWLDEVDPSCEITVILGKRRDASRANAQLNEFEEENEHYGDRRVWCPLYKTENNAFFDLIRQTNFEILPGRSLECDPCIHNTAADFQRLTTETIAHTEQLEQTVGVTMFAKPIAAMLEEYKNTPLKQQANVTESFDMGCGSPFACGE